MAEIIQIDNNTWRLEDGHVRFFLLEGEDKAVLLDSGVSNPDAKELATALTDKPLILVNTHGDGDHTSGTGAFDKVYMAAEDYINCHMADKYPGTELAELKDGDIIDLGGRRLEAIKIPGHTKGSVAYLDVEKRQLFAGDTVQSGHIFMFGPHRAPEAYEQALERLISISDRYDSIIASHDTPILPGDYASKVLESWREVKAGSYEAKEVELHNTRVNSFDAKYCGFYCDK